MELNVAQVMPVELKGKKIQQYLIGKDVFERHFDHDNQKNAILAPLIDYHDPGRNVSREPKIHSGSFHNTERFSINVSFNDFYRMAKSR